MKKILSLLSIVTFCSLMLVSCNKEYTITVQSNNDAWGTVTGGGTYANGATATLTAVPASGYYFNTWNDGNTALLRLAAMPPILPLSAITPVVAAPATPSHLLAQSMPIARYLTWDCLLTIL